MQPQGACGPLRSFDNFAILNSQFSPDNCIKQFNNGLYQNPSYFPYGIQGYTPI